MAEAAVLAIDPGREKVGIAVVDEYGKPLYLDIIGRSEIETSLENLLADFSPATIVIGDGTGFKKLAEEIRPLLPDKNNCELNIIEEKGSTSEAVKLYHNREGNLLVKALSVLVSWRPSRPLDDYAALVLAKKYLRNK